ncbi:MAG: hypothetical protein R6V01_06465 [Thermoplasmatota archaeon]
MRTAHMTAVALLAVMGLFMTSAAGGLGTAEENEYEDPFIEEALLGPGTDDSSSEDAQEGPGYDELVKRVYRYLTIGFPSNHCDWGRLPTVKDIFTANSSGRWMYRMLPRINATGEARIMDVNGDGIAELVIWRHVIANGTTVSPSREGNFSFQGEDLYGNRSSAFTLFYVDRDGDMNPEVIILHYHNVIRSLSTGTNTNVLLLEFHWRGIAMDLNDDGVRDAERFSTSRHLLSDRDQDENRELVIRHKASYSRSKVSSGRTWNLIKCTGTKFIYKDADSDGYPEVRSNFGISGHFIDRDGDKNPEEIHIGIQRDRSDDRNSDGNPEIVHSSRGGLRTRDRNSDGNPELISIVNRSREIFDNDSDGNWDLIVLRFRTYKYVDRNSDGRPELVIRKDIVRKIHPERELEGHDKDREVEMGPKGPGRDDIGEDDRGRIREQKAHRIRDRIGGLLDRETRK